MLTTVFPVKTFVAFADAAFLLAPGADWNPRCTQVPCKPVFAWNLVDFVGRERS
jgi:hypothetical protein